MKKAVSDFSQWFHSHGSELKRRGSEAAVSKVAKRLAKIHAGLLAEVSEGQPNWDFIVSAAGRAELFELADAIAAELSDVPGWTVCALKPALGFDFVIEINGREVQATELLFEPLTAASAPGLLGLRILFPDLSASDDDDEFVEIARLVLETGLGEREASSIDHLEVGPTKPAMKALGISELPEFLAWYRAKQDAGGSH